jgi:diguanylate cyclase (GGDEF)-like protein/PAS domain S-box-containing protein
MVGRDSGAAGTAGRGSRPGVGAIAKLKSPAGPTKVTRKVATAPRGRATRPPDKSADVAWAVRVLETLPDLVCICRKGRILYMNPAGIRLLGNRAKASVLGAKLRDFATPATARALGALVDNQSSRQEAVIGFRGRTPTAKPRLGRVVALPLGIGTEDRVLLRASEITKEARELEGLRTSNAALKAHADHCQAALKAERAERSKIERNLELAAKVIQTANEAVIVTNESFRVESVNPAFFEITGFAEKDVIGKRASLYAALKREGDLLKTFRSAIARHGHWEGEIWDRRKDGAQFAARFSVSAIRTEHSDTRRLALLMSDITKRKENDDRIRKQANYDALTGLPNRALFLDRLNQALIAGQRAAKQLGLMFIDLDGFKLVNDTLGHQKGDMLLKEAARRLAGCLRSADTLARLGGDEFTVIMPGLGDARNAVMVANRVLASLVPAFDLSGQEAFVSASIGIAVYPDDAQDLDHLLRNADAAMYRAKAMGKANFQFYTHDLNDEMKERVRLKAGLVRAAEREELTLHYQPKLDLSNGRCTGAEALMRWNSRELGSISPARFIPLLEETGLMAQVGQWAIDTACVQHKRWLDAGVGPIRIAVNVSARQLREADFAEMIARVLSRYGLTSDALEIEVTEDMLMADVNRTQAAILALHRMGLKVAIDDFGTGYSSLSFLKQFPIHTIKIDGSFISEVPKNESDVEIIKAIIRMGQSLNRRVSAEGVENTVQLEALRQFGCDEIQGYVLSPPLPGDQLIDVFRKEYTFASA